MLFDNGDEDNAYFNMTPIKKVPDLPSKSSAAHKMIKSISVKVKNKRKISGFGAFVACMDDD